jgi:hypothetical protein
LRRDLVWINVTTNPTAEWIARRLTEAFPSAPGYMIGDRDRIYGTVVTRRLRAMGIRDKPIAAASPWQKGFAERLIGLIRRECLDHIIVSGEAHLRRILIPMPLLQLRQNASLIEQGCADFSSDSTDRSHSFTPDPRRASPSLRPDLSFRYTQAAREEIDDGGHIEPAFACVRGHAVFEFSDDIVELNGVGYWLRTGLGLRRDIAPLSAIAPPRVERDCVTGTASTASQRPCRGAKLFTVPPLEPKSHRIIIS